MASNDVVHGGPEGAVAPVEEDGDATGDSGLVSVVLAVVGRGEVRPPVPVEVGGDQGPWVGSNGVARPAISTFLGTSRQG